MLAGVHAAVTAGGTLATVGVGIDGDDHAFFKALGYALAYPLYHGAYLMARHHGHLHHRVTTQVGTQVAATETYILHAKEHLTGTGFLRDDVY